MFSQPSSGSSGWPGSNLGSRSGHRPVTPSSAPDCWLLQPNVRHRDKLWHSQQKPGTARHPLSWPWRRLHDARRPFGARLRYFSIQLRTERTTGVSKYHACFFLLCLPSCCPVLCADFPQTPVCLEPVLCLCWSFAVLCKLICWFGCKITNISFLNFSSSSTLAVADVSSLYGELSVRLQH